MLHFLICVCQYNSRIGERPIAELGGNKLIDREEEEEKKKSIRKTTESAISMYVEDSRKMHRRAMTT